MSRISPATLEPVEPAPRRSFSKKQRLEILIASGGKCEICGGKIIAEFEVDHRIALALGGKDDATNWRAVHPQPCHAEKSQKHDTPMAAKVKRQFGMRLDQEPTRSATPIRSPGFQKRNRVNKPTKRSGWNHG